MRQRPTEPERRLWDELRAKRFHGTKFRRQKVIGIYIADFACRSPMLVIEVGGESHVERSAYDAARTDFLAQRGYQVLRFTNDEISRNIEAVLRSIEAALPPAPLPAMRRSPCPPDRAEPCGARLTCASPEGERGSVGV